MMKIDILRCIHFWKADVMYFQKKKKLKIEKKALIGNLNFSTSWWLIMNILNILRYKILWAQFLSDFQKVGAKILTKATLIEKNNKKNNEKCFDLILIAFRGQKWPKIGWKIRLQWFQKKTLGRSYFWIIRKLWWTHTIKKLKN